MESSPHNLYPDFAFIFTGLGPPDVATVTLLFASGSIPVKISRHSAVSNLPPHTECAQPPAIRARSVAIRMAVPSRLVSLQDVAGSAAHEPEEHYGSDHQGKGFPVER